MFYHVTMVDQSGAGIDHLNSVSLSRVENFPTGIHIYPSWLTLRFTPNIVCSLVSLIKFWHLNSLL